MATRKLLVDVHTHVYLPRYASFLRARASAPRIFANANGEDRLLILDNEPSGGRPIGPQYWDRSQKLAFMSKHGIDVSIVSSANPWLDFLPASTASSLAQELNQDLEAYCSTSPTVSLTPDHAVRSLYGFGLLPLVPGAPVSTLLDAVAQIAQLPHLKGLIMGTKGVGKGLDDAALEPVWAAIERAGLVVFLHPHYGVEASQWGEREHGHILPLALGFPFETTIATTRLILAGVFDRYPDLRVLLAHSGGALAQLSSRLASCIAHDPAAPPLKHDARYYLGKLYFDAVAYGAEELGFVSDVIARADGYAASASKESAKRQGREEGSRRMLFGTDHPFFPPLNGEEKWRSVVENLEAIERVSGWSEDAKASVKGGNALQMFGLV